MSATETEQIARDFFERLYAGDLGAALELFAEDGIWWMIGLLPASGRYVGRTALRTELLEPMGPVWEGNLQELTISNVVANDNHAVVELEAHGTTAASNHYKNYYCYVVRVKDGQIDRVRGYTDTGYALGVLWGPQRSGPPIE
jgi:ketosteroid isomerase-like protein